MITKLFKKKSKPTRAVFSYEAVKPVPAPAPNGYRGSNAHKLEELRNK